MLKNGTVDFNLLADYTDYQNCVRCLLTLCQLFVQIHSTKLCCAKINKNRS